MQTFTTCAGRLNYCYSFLTLQRCNKFLNLQNFLQLFFEKFFLKIFFRPVTASISVCYVYFIQTTKIFFLLFIL